jgi:hypothetical protein
LPIAVVFVSTIATADIPVSRIRCSIAFDEVFPRAKTLETSANENVRQAHAITKKTHRSRVKQFVHYLRIRETLFNRPAKDAKVLSSSEIAYIRHKENLPGLTNGEVERVYANYVATHVRELTVELREQLARTVLAEYGVELIEADMVDWRVRWLGKILGGINHWSPVPKGEGRSGELEDLVRGVFSRDIRILTKEQVDAVLRVVELEKARPQPNMKGKHSFWSC